MVMMISVVELSPSLLEVVVLLLCLAQQLVLKLVEYCEDVFTSCGGLCGFWKLKSTCTC